MPKQKFWLSIAMGITLLAIMLLTAALPRLELRPGSFFTPQARAELKALLSQFVVYRNPLLALITALMILVFVWSIYARRKTPALPPAPRKKRSIWATLIHVILWTIALIIIRRQLMQGGFKLNPPQVGNIPSLSAPNPYQVVAANIPDWFAFLFSLLLVLLLGVILWRAWQRRRRPPKPALELLVQEARSARQALQAGEDFRNVILRCYYEMGQVLDRQRGIRRKEGMTAREFQHRLVNLGLPEEPVGQLTRLFEMVRYGAKEPGKQAERQALECLEAIVQASRSAP